MSTVAKASITLTSVSDAYSVSLTPSVCVIHADFDGSNPVLTNAFTAISAYCGKVQVPFTLKSSSASSEDIQYTVEKLDDYTYRMSIVHIGSEILCGAIDFIFLTSDGAVLPAKFQFNVERESTMLDWIQEWENNKTTIGATSIITPKMFVGKKITGSYDTLAEVPGLTGVYIGPSENDSCGLYGYKDSVEIFHIDETGGKIGGWSLLHDGLYSTNGKMQMLSNGSMWAINDEDDIIWKIYEDGSASFALGNVRFSANGDAEFKGKVLTSSGSIAGWEITDSQLYCIPIALSAAKKYIAVANISSYPLGEDGNWNGEHFDWVKWYGGAALYYTSSIDFGFIAYNSQGKQVFASGSTNFIAGWSFDENALWIGEKNNNAQQYTGRESSLTIGTQGLRGYSWYIDTNGTASFVKGIVTFGHTSGSIAGWTLADTKLATNNIALVSSSADKGSGLYMTAREDGNFVGKGVDAIVNFIHDNGGVYLTVTSGSANFASYDSGGSRLFQLRSNGESYISGWCFDNEALWTGEKVSEGFAGDGHITLGPTGLRGCNWRFENDGSGSVAGGKISWESNGEGSICNGKIKWDAAGNIQFDESVSMIWRQEVTNALETSKKLTKIDANGIYTGTLTAEQINGLSCTFAQGTIGGWIINADTITKNDIYLGSNGDIYCSYGNIEYWRINNYGQATFAKGLVNFSKNGSGYVAGGNISWNEKGDITFSESVLAQWGQGVNTAQMIACGKMLYRDPEFSKGYNGTEIYAYGSFDYCTFSASRLAIAINNYGLLLRGSGCITRVDVIKANGTVSTIFTGSKQIYPDTTTNLRGSISVDMSDTIRISYTGEGAWLRAETYDDNGNSLGWVNLCGLSGIIGSEYINTSRALVSDVTASNGTQTVVRIINTRWISKTDFRLGGLYFANQSRTNAKFIARIVAKIPIGWKIENYHNSYGNGCKTEWTTSQSGTGTYTEYICVVTCGSSGTFSTINHFALVCDDGYTAVENTDEFETGIKRKTSSGSYNVDNVVWYVAYASIFDTTSSDKITTAIDVNGIYTGTLRADQIVAGTIDATKISADVILSNGNAWALNKDGSGYLANKKVDWDKEGNMRIVGSITQPFEHLRVEDFSACSDGTGKIALVKQTHNFVITSDSTEQVAAVLFLPCTIAYNGIAVNIIFYQKNRPTVGSALFIRPWRSDTESSIEENVSLYCGKMRINGEYTPSGSQSSQYNYECDGCILAVGYMATLVAVPNDDWTECVWVLTNYEPKCVGLIS